METTPAIQKEARCSKCWKSLSHCICSEIKEVSAQTKLLILQHPQEARNPWSSARLASLTVKDSVHRVGLSWPSLRKALGRETDPKKWGVLYLGTQKSSTKELKKPFQVLNSRGNPAESQELEGIVLLDGNWKQSKALWWRNPWLLRLNRVILAPESQSEFGKFRKQPRKECLSTIEAAAATFRALGERAEVPDRLLEALRSHLEKESTKLEK